jgi:gluconolactonase
MKFKYKLIVKGLAIFLSPFSSLYAQTSDYVPEKIFTSGIEGPAVDRNGNLYAVNFKEEGTIGIIDKYGKVKKYVKLENGSIGNGIRFDKNGVMYIADYVNHNILKIKSNNRIVIIYAHNDMMNQPNDLAISQNGVIYASDPDWKNNTGKLWKISTDGIASLLEENMGTTNGIEVSPNEKTLYVNESNQRKVWKYDIDKKTGDLINKKLLIQFDDHGLDGMRCDVKGNLYITRYGAGEIAIVSPEGKLLKSIKLKGLKPSNVAFGGVDGKTVYVTLQDRGTIEYFTSKHAGREWQMWR